MSIRNIFDRRRKEEIICHSEEEMNRRADSLIEQGYKVQRESGVQLVQPLYFATYKVKYWR